MLARLGGDEFVVFMPDTDDMAARAAIERLRHTTAVAIARTGFQVTFTTGLATFERLPGALATILREVDRLLYKGKRWRKSSVSSTTVLADPTPAITLRITRPRTRLARG